MDETKLLNYLKGESDAEECLEVEAWYHASAEHKKQLDQLYYMLFVGERKVAMDGVDTENSLSVLKDRIKQKESEKKSVHRIRVSKWKRYAMPLAAFLHRQISGDYQRLAYIINDYQGVHFERLSF